jgi:signal transduction histidine kinase
MDKAAAKEALRSTSADIRLAGARFFARYATDSDKEHLMKALSSESVPWIKRALERAIAKGRNGAKDQLKKEDPHAALSSSAADPPSRLVFDMRAKAVEEVAQTLLHEFSPMIGQLRLSVREEIADYQESRTWALLGVLSDLLEAIRNLKRAAEAPHIEEFDLSELVSSTINSLRDIAEGVDVHLVGPQHFLVNADRQAMRLALVNGLRNAFEAVAEKSHTDPPQIAVNWGRGGAEDWLVLLDSGPGFPDDPGAALKLGVTNKEGHIGYGLATAQFALRSMQGDVIVSNDPNGGARFELRWEAYNANTPS